MSEIDAVSGLLGGCGFVEPVVTVIFEMAKKDPVIKTMTYKVNVLG